MQAHRSRISNKRGARRASPPVSRLRGGIAERERVEGELLEVQEDGLLLNTREAQEGGGVKGHLVLVPYTAMENVRAEKLNLSVLDKKDNWPEDDVRHLNVMRHPRGENMIENSSDC